VQSALQEKAPEYPLRHFVRGSTELLPSPEQVLCTMSSSGTHSKMPPAPEPSAPSSGASHHADEFCSTCGAVLHRTRTDDPASQYVHVSVRFGPCAVSSSGGAALHVGNDAWQLGARCMCPSALCTSGEGGGRVRIPPGARVWFECPSCGLLFGSVADFDRHDCRSQGSCGAVCSSGMATSGRGSSRT